MNADEMKPPRGSAPATASPGRILVVDDDPAIRTMLAEMLRGTGYNVSCAEDGEAAWDALCAENFDLMIADHDMPRLTGTDLLRRIRAGAFPLPVILISGQLAWPDPAVVPLLSPGVAMEKPFSWAGLEAVIRSFLIPTAQGAGSGECQPQRL